MKLRACTGESSNWQESGDAASKAAASGACVVGNLGLLRTRLPRFVFRCATAASVVIVLHCESVSRWLHQSLLLSDAVVLCVRWVVQAYTQVLERRLLEICPDHAIPVTEEHLGMPVTSLSRLATTAAAGLIASGSAGSTAASSSLAAKASHVLAATAAHRKEAVDSADSMRRLEKSVRALRAQVVCVVFG